MKKIVLFIVEGDHDAAEISVAINHLPIFRKFLSKYQPEFRIVHTDITSVYGHNEKNIVEKVKNEITSFFNEDARYVIFPTDIACVIHLVDTDGAFIDSNHIHYEEVNKFLYEDDSIKTSSPNKVKERNKIKTENLQKLIGTKKIHNFNYNIFYVSCNMDHFLFSKHNCTKDEKKNNEINFKKLCKEEPDEITSTLKEFFLLESFTYDESWEYIKENNRSLHRQSNLNLAFKYKNKQIVSITTN